MGDRRRLFTLIKSFKSLLALSYQGKLFGHPPMKHFEILETVGDGAKRMQLANSFEKFR